MVHGLVDHWLMSERGPDPRVWITFFGLVNDWEFTMGQLVETTTLLSNSRALVA